jgi:hypothetical protein
MSCSTDTAVGYTKVTKPTAIGIIMGWGFLDKTKTYYLEVDVPAGLISSASCKYEKLGKFINYDEKSVDIVPNSFPNTTSKEQYIKTYKHNFNTGSATNSVYEVKFNEEDSNGDDPPFLSFRLKKEFYNKGARTTDGTVLYPIRLLIDNLYTKNDENPAPAAAGGSKKRKQRKTGRKMKSKRTKTNKKVYKR